MKLAKTVFVGVVCAASLCGCLHSAPPAAVNWTLDFRPYASAQPQAAAGEMLTAGPVRISQVQVRPPDSGARLMVLREDGSVAFDNYNQFAAAPALLMRNLAEDVFANCGRFPGIVVSSSGVTTPYAVEVNVTRLALDCRQTGRRDALVELNVVLVASHKIVSTGYGEACTPTGDGNYSAAFSKAATVALGDAIRMLRKE